MCFVPPHRHFPFWRLLLAILMCSEKCLCGTALPACLNFQPRFATTATVILFGPYLSAVVSKGRCSWLISGDLNHSSSRWALTSSTISGRRGSTQKIHQYQSLFLKSSCLRKRHLSPSLIFRVCSCGSVDAGRFCSFQSFLASQAVFRASRYLMVLNSFLI